MCIFTNHRRGLEDGPGCSRCLIVTVAPLLGKLVIAGEVPSPSLLGKLDDFFLPGKTTKLCTEYCGIRNVQKEVVWGEG